MLRKSPRLVPLVVLLMTGALLAPGTQAEAGPTGPTVVNSFDGIANLDPFASPSDATGAVGLDYYVAAVNVHVQIWDRAGVSQLGPLRLKSLFNDLPDLEETDPKVIYDPYDNRFVLVFLLFEPDFSSSKIVVVVIPDPTAKNKNTWCHYVYEGDQITGGGSQFADYPGLGFTSDRVTVTTNNFPSVGSGFDYVQILSFKKSELYQQNCNPTPAPTVLGGNDTDVPDGSKAFTVQPAETVGGANPKVQYMSSFDLNGARKEDVVLWRLKFKNGKPKLANTAIPVGQVKAPSLGGQCDGTGDVDTQWDTGDARLTNAYYDVHEKALYTAHAVSHQFGAGASESAVRWYEVKPKPTLDHSSVKRKAFVGAEDVDAGWPSVATDADGVLFVNYSQASEALDECLSIYASTIQPGETADAATQVIAGVSQYNAFSGSERWGDYSAINRDPGDPNGTTMAMFNAYAVSSTLWQQLVATVTA